MHPRMVTVCAVGLATSVVAGCHPPENSELYGDPPLQTSGGGTQSGGASAGGSSNDGGGVGGAPSGGGFTASGGGTTSSSGGFTSFPSGGTSGGAGGVPPASGGAGGEFNPLKCNFTGAFASHAKIPVRWDQTLVLNADHGFIEQRALTIQVQMPGTFIVKTKTYPCGILLPDLQANIFQAGLKFGIRFLPALFDRGVLAPAEFEIRGAPTATGAELVSEPFALLAGISMKNPVTDAWPATAAEMDLQDDDKDGRDGVTVAPATGNGYGTPPVNANPFDDNRSLFIDIAERTVQTFRGDITSCDAFGAELDILTVANKPAIDATIVGCTKMKGEICTAEEAKFIDDNRPAFVPTGPGHLEIQRVPDGSECPDVRKVFPVDGD